MSRPKGSKNKTTTRDDKGAFERYWDKALQEGTKEWRERQDRLLARKLREQPLKATLALFIKKIESDAPQESQED